MKPYQWIAAFVIGIVLNVVDVILTIELLESGLFFEANIFLRWMFADGLYLSIYVIKCIGWFIIMCLSLHHLVKRWVTPKVIWVTTTLLGLIVLSNLFFFIQLP